MFIITIINLFRPALHIFIVVPMLAQSTMWLSNEVFFIRFNNHIIFYV
jgi:hypothetical protein